MSIFDPVPGASYDESGKLVEAAPASGPTTSAAEPITASATTATEPVSAPVVATNTNTATPQEINWESVLAEKTGGKFKSWDEIIPKISQDAPAPYSFANDESKRVADYLAQGKIDDVYSVLHEQRRLSSLDKMNDAEVLRIQLEYQHPNFTAEDISDEISSKYQAEKPDEPVEDDYLDEDAYKVAKKQYDKEYAKYEKDQKRLDRQQKMDADAARQTLADYKKDIILPDINPIQTADTTPAFDESAWKAAREEYLTSLNKTSADFKEIPFEVNDEGVTFKGTFQIEDGERAALVKDLAEKDVVNDILLPRYDKGGVYDTKQLMEDVYFLNNKDKIIKAAIRQAIAQTSFEHLKTLKNIDLDQGQRGVITEASPEAQRKEFAKLVFGN